MNKVLLIAEFFLNEDGIWKFQFRLFQGDYETDVKEQIDKFWHENLPDWSLTIKQIHNFDSYGSAPIAEINK